MHFAGNESCCVRNMDVKNSNMNIHGIENFYGKEKY